MAIDEAASGALSPVELCKLSGHTMIVRLIGEHDLFTKPRLTEQLHRARLADTVIVDLTGCTFLDSTIISTILGARLDLLSPRIELVLPPAGSISYRALHVAGVPTFFVSYATLEEAVSADMVR